MTEKERRIYYQSIVYEVCNALDRIDGRKPGTGIICGTADNPSDNVQRRMSELEDEIRVMRGYINGTRC